MAHAQIRKAKATDASRPHHVQNGVTGESLVRGNDELGFGVATHALNGAGGASAYGIDIAAGTLCDDGDGAVAATQNESFVIEWIGAYEVDDKAGILRTASEDDRGADFNAESRVRLGLGNAGGRGRIGVPAPDVDGAR